MTTLVFKLSPILHTNKRNSSIYTYSNRLAISMGANCLTGESESFKMCFLSKCSCGAEVAPWCRGLVWAFIWGGFVWRSLN